jgi:hypothetical protein
MEYVSVPWDNHRSGDPDKYKDLTVNLALWFIHILAGNRHEISWDYGALTSEKPATELNTSFTAPTSSQVAADPGKLAESREEPISWGLRSFSRKRKRNEPHEDVIHYSFSESQQFATQVFVFQSEYSKRALNLNLVNRLSYRTECAERFQFHPREGGRDVGRESDVRKQEGGSIDARQEYICQKT